MLVMSFTGMWCFELSFTENCVDSLTSLHTFILTLDVGSLQIDFIL